MNTIWFDVTTSYKWKRPAVGIVRVQTECFKYLAGLHSEQIKFCRYDKKRSIFIELSTGEVFEALKNHGGVEKPPPPKTARIVVDQTRKALEVVPEPIRDPMLILGRKSEPFLRTTLHNYRLAAVRVKNTADHIGQMLKRPETIEASDLSSVAARFRRGDVLVSGGLDWDEKDLEHQYLLKRDCGLKQIHFCHDLIPVKLPQMCVGEVAGYFSRYFTNMAWCSDEVLCVSKSSERDLIETLKLLQAPIPRTRVIRLGSKIPSETSNVKAEDLVQGKYLLFVSTVERRKNHEVLYRAMSLLADQGRTDLPKLVFVGMFGWGVTDLMNDLKFDYRVRDRVVMLHNITDEQLSALYRGAEFTLYPSHYEGWGLPLAESLAHGKFCLSSNTSSLPEVAGDLVEYIDPWDMRRWAERIAWWCDHPEEVANREADIRKRYKPISWEETGKTLYQSALDVIAAPEEVAQSPMVATATSRPSARA